MHRATPRRSAYRSYVAGGARTIVDQADDKKQMQEMGGNFMKGETREKVEAPQNYGFTSVVNPADKGQDGQITDGAEGFVSFMGGNRPFPVCSIMDDRRHRLKELDPGDSAMYGSKEWGQQFLIQKDGMIMSGNEKKKIRFQLVKNKNEKQQQQGQGGGGAGAQALAETGQGSQGSQGGQGSQQQDKGQKSLHKEESKTFIDITEKAVTITRGKGTVIISDDSVIGYHGSKENSFKADANHTHIKHGNNAIFVDASGCWSTSPIQQKSDPD